MIDSSAIHYDTPFHLLVGACELEDAERLLPVFASSAMEVFPFHVAAANFALKAEYLKGAVLCFRISGRLSVADVPWRMLRSTPS